MLFGISTAVSSMHSLLAGHIQIMSSMPDTAMDLMRSMAAQVDVRQQETRLLISILSSPIQQLRQDRSQQSDHAFTAAA